MEKFSSSSAKDPAVEEMSVNGIIGKRLLESPLVLTNVYEVIKKFSRIANSSLKT